MRQTVVYWKQTGRIEMNSTVSHEIVMATFDPVLFDFIELELEQEQFDPLDNMYINDGEVTARPEMVLTHGPDQIPADGVATFLISNVPSGAKVEVYGPISDEWVESSGEVSLSVNIPGGYTVLLECFPYQSAKVKFDAT